MATYKYLATSEQLKQSDCDFDILKKYHYINIGATTVDQLQKVGMLPKKSYIGLTQNKPDGLILHGKNDVRALVEYKKDGVFASKEEAFSIIPDWYFNFAEKFKLQCYLCK